MKLRIIALAISIASGSCTLLDPDEEGNLVPKTVDSDPNLPRLMIGGRLYHGETFGNINNPILILLHGGPGSDYRALISDKNTQAFPSRYPNRRVAGNYGMAALADQYFIVCYSMRGAGLSPRLQTGQIGIRDYFTDVKDIAAHFIAEKNAQTGSTESRVYLLGYSYGGYIAAGFANLYPQMVKDIVLYEPAPLSLSVRDATKFTSPLAFIGSRWIDEYALTRQYLTPDSHARADYDVIIPANLAQKEMNSDPDEPRWRFGAFIRREIDAMNPQLNADYSGSYDVTSNLKSFTGRVLMLYGSRTEAFPDKQRTLNEQASYFNTTKLVEIEGAGHSGPWTHSAQCISAIRAFIPVP